MAGPNPCIQRSLYQLYTTEPRITTYSIQMNMVGSTFFHVAEVTTTFFLIASC